jgi:3-hydroxyacyl-CoA dehydrogenase
MKIHAKDIKKIAILGAGTMSPGIAQSFASGGYGVCVYNFRELELPQAKQVLQANLDTFVEEDWYTAEQADDIRNRIRFTTDLADALNGAQFVQETVSENADIKRSVFAQAEEFLTEDAILVCNASSLNPFELAPESRLANFAAAHWFAPPHILPLVEVCKGEKTSEATMRLTLELLKECGKTPVRLEKFVPGYLINRIQILLNAEVFYLLEEGICTPEQLDLAVKASFMPRGMVLGLVQRYDFTGLDISANNIENASYRIPETSAHPKALFSHVDKGELGVKTGKGFYDYGGRGVAELNKKRDKLLMRVLESTQEVVKQRI